MAKFTLEIEFEITGRYEPGTSGGYMDAPEPDHVEVHDLVAVRYLTRDKEQRIALSREGLEFLFDGLIVDDHVRELMHDAIAEEGRG